MGKIIDLNHLGKILIETSDGQRITIKLKNSSGYIRPTVLYIEADKSVKVVNIKRDEEEIRNIFGSRGRK